MSFSEPFLGSSSISNLFFLARSAGNMSSYFLFVSSLSFRYSTLKQENRHSFAT